MMPTVPPAAAALDPAGVALSPSELHAVRASSPTVPTARAVKMVLRMVLGSSLGRTSPEERDGADERSHSDRSRTGNDSGSVLIGEQSDPVVLQQDAQPGQRTRA